MTPSIILLTDYRGTFFSSTTRVNGVDIEVLRAAFADAGYTLHVRPYAAVDLQRQSYAGQFVIYQSSEDTDLHYRSFIEDILLALRLQGAHLIPRFEYCRAHHNKVFMELLRAGSSCAALHSVQAHVFGAYEDFLRARATAPLPAVVKSAAGAGSSSVAMARTPAALARLTRRVSRVPGHLWWHVKDFLAQYKHRGYIRASRHRRKFIVQPFIAGLAGDYKVLVFGEKYYVLQRANRPGDFRASGSGRFIWPEDVPPALLDAAHDVFTAFDAPYISLDLAYDGRQYHVLEFQFVSFGPLTMQRSRFCFMRRDGQWCTVEEQPVLERELAASVVRYLNAQHAQ